MYSIYLLLEFFSSFEKIVKSPGIESLDIPLWRFIYAICVIICEIYIYVYLYDINLKI